ncbi:MAG: polysaccharide biosynthesis/export family protein [bacterium]
MRKKKKTNRIAIKPAITCVFLLLFVFQVALPCLGAELEREEERLNRILHNGDRVHIRIPAEPELSGEYEIMANGKFYFPVLEDLDFGSVLANDKTVKEVEEEIRKRLNKYYADDSVSVDLIAVEARPGEGVSIFGKVDNPGMMKYEEGLKLVDLLIKAGSFREAPNLHKVSLFRDDKVTYLDISDLVQGRDFTSNIDLKEGDIIIVPGVREYSSVRVTVLGKVGRPGTYMVSEDSLVLEAISEAEGPYGRAAVGKTIIIRMQDGEPTVLHVDIKAMLGKADLTQNIRVRDGDIIYVPETERFDVMRVVNDLLNLNLLRRTVRDDIKAQ